VAWSVVLTGTYYYGQRNPLAFDKVFTNVGNIWQTTSSSAVINVKGNYYVSVTFSTCSESGAIVEVRVDGVTAFTCQLMIATHFTGQSRSQSAVLSLNMGQTLSVTISDATIIPCIYGEYQSNFMGFLLSAA
jgi:hypothetical protein